MYKLCYGCNKNLPIINFGKRKASKDGLHYRCNDCRKNYRKSNKKYIDSYNLKYRSVPEHREKHKNYCSDYNKNNKDRIRMLRANYRNDPIKLKKLKDNIKKWRVNNKTHIYAYNLKRYHKRKKVDVNYSKKDIEYTFSLFENKCFKCKNTKKLAIDHHYPLSKEFGLSKSNAVLLCKSCNSKKYTKNPEDFYTQEELIFLENLGIKKIT